MGLVVNVNQAKALAVAAGPFKVVHQRPVEVAANVGAGFDRLSKLRKVGADKVDALDVVALSVGTQVVGAAYAVLRDEDWLFVAFPNKLEKVVH